MLVAMGVFGWLVWTSKEEPGVGHVAGARPANIATSSIPDEEYEQLAAFQAPQYAREPAAPKAFLAAMERYDKQDYAGAASALRTVTDANPALVPAKFYLGISLLLSGDRIGGIQELRALTETGDAPYLDRARFYLAKGLLAEHDSHRAEEQLEKLVAQHGELEKQAAALLDRIRSS